MIGIDKRKENRCIYCGEIFYHESLERCPYCLRVMEEQEYKDNERVLHKTKVKLILPHKEPEGVECFVTEGHVIIEAEGG